IFAKRRRTAACPRYPVNLASVLICRKRFSECYLFGLEGEHVGSPLQSFLHYASLSNQIKIQRYKQGQAYDKQTQLTLLVHWTLFIGFGLSFGFFYVWQSID
ncbi:MAG: hypothetical protein ABI597_07535, partial [Gammaproteobacteria bacterium]